MTASAAPTVKPATKPSKSKSTDDEAIQSTRETVESVIVAFILAFLFRAFVAEAFVIPTGSMAPTLMGAHKDIFCEYCGQQYQASASDEFNSQTGARTSAVTIASTCSVCRAINSYDFVGNKNHSTFSGDRILVSKFDYILSKPQRWDVLVFKWPEGARMNYIKRLIGLPGETLLLTEGDVLIKTKDNPEWNIARKPPHKIQAMKQIVSDTNHRAKILTEQGFPSLWQPLAQVGSSSWAVENTQDTWKAELSPSANVEFLRYYHKTVDEVAWDDIEDGQQLSPVDPYASELITDYLAYNSSFLLGNAKRVFEEKNPIPMMPAFLSGTGWKPKDEITSEYRAFQYAREKIGSFAVGRGPGDGHHWVGDLSGQFDIEVKSDSGTLVLDIVEFGIHFQCLIDVSTGDATLQAVEGGNALPAFGGKTQVTGSTSVRGKGSYQLEFCNFDDQLVLWVNGKVTQFETAGTFDSREFRNGAARRPYWTEADPLDAAPVAIGGANISLAVNRAKVFRDIYYIAIQSSTSYSDYDLRDFRGMAAAIPDPKIGIGSTLDVLTLVYSNPQWWSETNLFAQRNFREFKLEEGQYFPMGDNSASSSDARAWRNKFVGEKYLLGKALLVFWPHTWNSPLPFTPHFARMGRIR